jgi:hypothetical protein
MAPRNREQHNQDYAGDRSGYWLLKQGARGEGEGGTGQQRETDAPLASKASCLSTGLLLFGHQTADLRPRQAL